MISIKNKIDIRLAVIFLLYGIIYALISLVNHYNFRTYGWDLGLFNNALYDYSHFKWNDETLLLPYLKITNSLGDHFSLITLFISPFVWIFGTYTMLIFQIAIILWGGYGIFRLVEEFSGSKKTGYYAVIHFLSLWGIYSSLSFDYHENVVAAMLVPWFIYFVFKKKYLFSSIYLSLILITKENMALWAVFVCLGLISLFYKEKKTLIYLVICSFLSGIFFLLVTKILIPYFSGSHNGYIHFRYDALGPTMTDAFLFLINHPLKAFTMLFENHLNDPMYYGVKSELHYAILLSGGIALLYRPQFLIMLIPIFFQKLFNNEATKWGVNLQYSAEFAPVLTIALFYALRGIRKESVRKYLTYASLILAILSTINILENKASFSYVPEQAVFYQKRHYSIKYDAGVVYQSLKKIPRNAKVSAQNMLIPHLAIRDSIYYFPYIGDADYIVLMPAAKNPYPITEKEYSGKIDSLICSSNWEIIHNDNTLLILQKDQADTKIHE